MRSRGLRPVFLSLALALALLAGCADLKTINPFRPQDSSLDMACSLASPDKTAGERRELVTRIETRYQQNPRPDNLLALAIAYAVPGQEQSSTRKALDMLDKLDTGKLSRSSRLLADWLSSDIAYRDSLEQSNSRMSGELARMGEALRRAREKIEILTRIEQTIGPEPQIEQGTGGPKH
jgi:hypothetical protein